MHILSRTRGLPSAPYRGSPSILAPVPSLYDLASRLQAFGTGELTRAELEGWFAPVLTADPLDVSQSDPEPWEDTIDEERLFWRLLYFFDASDTPDDALKLLARRVVACLGTTGSAAETFELLPVVLDQDRFCTIVERHAAGVISRVGLLSVIARSGYPAHVKLWLQYAPLAALQLLCARLTAGEYGRAARLLERPPV